MSTSQFLNQRWMQFRNFILELTGFAMELASATAVAGAVTQNLMNGQITSESLATAAAGKYTLTVTNSNVAAADSVFCTVSLVSGTAANFYMESAKAGAGSFVVNIKNADAGAFVAAVFRIDYYVIKKITGITRNV